MDEMPLGLILKIDQLKESIENIKIPDNVEVNNLDYIKKYLRDELNILAKSFSQSIKDLPTPQFNPVFKPELTTNYPETIKVTDIEKVISGIDNLRTIMEAIDFAPQIHVDAPIIPEIKLPFQESPTVNVPAPIVNIPPTLIDLASVIEALMPLSLLSDQPDKPISVRMSDGEKFIEALKEVARGQREFVTQYVPGNNGMTDSEFKTQYRLSTHGSAIVSGAKSIGVAGVAEKLVAVSTPCFCVDVGADTGNTGIVAVGGADVVATEGSQKGSVLFGGNPMTRIYIDDVSKLYGNTTVNGGRIIFNYYTY
jgi:hypothetical protein